MLKIICMMLLCTSAIAGVKEKPVKESPLVLMAKEAVLLNLKDADSAKFRNVVELDATSVCGYVNSKNGYGGYAGFRQFLWRKGREVKMAEGEKSELWWEYICGNPE